MTLTSELATAVLLVLVTTAILLVLALVARHREFVERTHGIASVLPVVFLAEEDEDVALPDAVGNVLEPARAHRWLRRRIYGHAVPHQPRA